MSFNHSRSDRSEQQYRKSGRSASSNQQRNSSGAYGKGAGGGPAPSPSFSSNRSFKKSNNAQGGQSRVNSPAVNTSESSNASAAGNIQNGAHVQPQLQGASDAPVGRGAAKPVESPATQKSTRAVPQAPTSQPATMSSDSSFPTTPAKGDESKAFSLQFGSISPGYGMQIPARTRSAPPNLDEQKRDQARHDSSFRSVPHLPIPVPKQQLPRKDSVATDQSNSREAHPLPKVKKNAQASVPPPVNQTQKPSLLKMSMTSMQVPFHHQPQVSMQFGGPNPQIQSQSVTATSIQMPMHMPLPMGNAPQVQQQVFVQGLQAHPLPPQGMMHQGQGLSFTPPIGGQLAPQLGNLGMGIAPQYSQQQGGKFGVPRKTTPVKITHPHTHEELRLDKRTDTYSDGGSSGPRSHPNVPSQSQPMPSFAPSHSVNYYPNSYNTNSMFYPPPSSLASSQIAPNAQGPRFNYPVSQGHQNISFMNSAAAHGSQPVNKSINLAQGTSESPNVEPTRDAHNVTSSAPSGSTQVTVKAATVSVREKVADSSLSSSLPTVEKLGSLKPSVRASEVSSSQAQRDLDTCQESSVQQPKPGSESSTSKSLPAAAKHSGGVPATNLDESLPSNSLSSAPAVTFEESMPVVANNEGRKRESLSRSNSIKDYQKKPGKKGHIQPPNQYTSTSNLASHTAEHGISSDSAVSETVEAKTALTSSSAANVLSQSTRELPIINDASPSSLELKIESKREGLTSVSSEVSGTRRIVDSLDMVQHAKMDGSSKLDEQPKPEISGIKDEEEIFLSEEHLKDDACLEIPSQPVPLKFMELKSDRQSASKGTATCIDVPISGTAQRVLNEDVEGNIENERVSDSRDVSTSRIVDSTDVEGSHADMTFGSGASSSATDSNEITVNKSGAPNQQSAPVPTPDLSESTSKYEGEGVPVPSSKEKPVPELSRTKSAITSGKKKMKEILLKADAAGTSDLYMAYKGPEEKEMAIPSANAESNSIGVNLKQASLEAPQVDAIESEKIAQNKAEPDDWEDAADISTPKLETSDNCEKAHGGLVNHEKDGSGNIAKKYSRDFLLKFAEQCTDLPQGFEIASDIAETLMAANVNASHFVDRDSYPSPGRIIDRQSSGSRLDRRASGMVDDDRCNKLPGSFGPGRDLRLDLGYGAAVGFRPGQGGNFGVLRPPRAQAPLSYVGGILAGPMQHMGPQGGMLRNSPDADRWQRAANYQQKGLIPSPRTPLQMMHRAERKYEVGKVADEEEAKQRQLKGILNKLTPQNFDKLFEQVKAVNIDNAVTLSGVISQIFDKALMEPTFCEMYANFCYHLAGELPDLSEDNEKITFKRLLLNKCQEEFERGEREQEEANKVEEEGEAKQSEEEREEKRIKARRRMLGNIRLIGELYKKKMLTERIMHSCIKKLLGEYENPDEEDVEALCTLMSTIGDMIDHPKAKVYMDAYFERMAKLSNNMKLSSRVRFMLKDAIDLRKNKWQQRRKVEGLHRDAAQEQQAQTSRLAHGPGINPAERKYEVGKVADEEHSKQRQLKAILNKLTPQNFEKLFEQVKAVNIDNAVTLTRVISQIFDKALMEPTFCEMYANFCYHLAGELPDFSEDNEKITFKRLLLNKCQEEFERGEREQEEANKVEEEGEAKQSEEEREEKRIKARRRMLGNIRLIGELYKKKMLTERIMHECIKKLLGEYENPDEEDVEALCKLMSTIGDMIDHTKAKVHMDAYFERMAKLSNNMKLSSRVRFMLKDAIDLRKNKWQQRRKVEGPKKIEEVHRDAAQERQAQTSRLARGPGINPAARRAPMDFGPRASMLSSPGAQMGSFRGLPTQLRGFGAQDVRMDDRQSLEARTLSVPFPQRPIGDDSITLGPQGGLARGMSFRGPPAMSSAPLADVSLSSGDSRRMAAGLNGFNSLSDRTAYGSREDLMPRYVTDRFAAPAAHDQLSSQERGMNFSNRDLKNPDRSFDRPLAASPPARGQTSGFTQSIPPEEPEECLREMSMAAIKEFYSARDEKEVALCINDLNSRSFHPTMIAVWVTDSFERKDMERDLLAKLLVNLARSRDGVLSQVELVKGFESVLSTLEDAVNDAPKAAEFLGRIFAKVIVENVISLREIGLLIHDGGEEPGRLLEIGLAGDVLGCTLGVIKTEKGETVLNEIQASSNLRLEDFRPPDPNRSRILENFI